jgi:putative heme-binding domain-containing protein
VNRTLLTIVLVFAAAPAFAADPLPKVPDGFMAELVLQAPDVEAPTALCVAPNGDVYFAEDPMDMRGPPTKNIDKIWLLKGGDPKQKVLFADQMWAVMGLEIVGDKLYVVHAPHVTAFTLDAEGKAKSRTELFDDLGPKVAGRPSFNDHIPSGIRMGMDGWLYVSIGDKGIPKMDRVPIPLRGTGEGKRIEKEGSVHVAEGRWRRTKEGHHISLEGGGVIRFRPDGTGLEVFASGTRNHLDVPLDQHDRIFVRDNTDDGLGWNTRFMNLPRDGFLGYPWAYKYGTQDMLPMVHDFGGGSPCGGYVYNDDGLPATYRGRVFHCEWGQGKVWAVKVIPDGAGFKYVDQIAFMDPAGAVKDFRPFTLRPTADGRGFYVTDWGFSGWLQNKSAGRIWKVTYTKDDVKPAPRGKDGDSIAALIASLSHPALTERLRAQRALVALGKPAREAAVDALNRKGVGKTARIHLLWVQRETADRESIAEWWLRPAYDALRDADADVRLEAVRILGSYRPEEFPHGVGKIPYPLDYMLSLLPGEKDAQVRLAAVSLLGRQVFSVFDAKALLAHLGAEADPVVRLVAVNALKEAAGRGADRDDKVGWNWGNLEARFDEIAPKQPRGVEALLEALREEYDPAAVRVAQRLAEQGDAATRRRALDVLGHAYKQRKPYAGGWWGTQPAGHRNPPRDVAWEGTPLVREAILKALGDKDEGVRKAAVAALAAARDPETLVPLQERFDKEKDPAAQVDLVRAVAGLQARQSVEFLRPLLIDPDRPEDIRLAALDGLEKINTPDAGAAIAGCLCTKASAAFEVRVMQALAVTKPADAGRVVAAALRSERAPVRAAAAAALGKIGGADADKLLVGLLDDKDSAVRVAAIQALGALKAKAAIPALVQAAGNEATQFDAITALAAMPDARALTAYLTGLTSKNVELRKACRGALAAIRDQAAPALEQLAQRKEIPAAALPELREVFSSFAPVLSWQLIGPFPRDGKVHPPQTEQKLDAVYKGAGKDVRWRAVSADAKDHGRLNLAARLSPTEQVVAYAFAEIDSTAARDAALLVGSDDTITIWLNGKKVHDHQGDRGWAYNQDRVAVRLEKGKNRLLIQCGNSSGPWEFSVAVSGESDRYAFLKGGAGKLDLEAFRAYARKNQGDATRGAKLFADLKGLACAKCHAVAGQGGQVGPDLAGIALKYKREDLMTSVLEPSKVIAQGYETIVISTTKGKTISGVFKGETADAVNLADAEGKMLSVAKKDIDERAFSPISMMPNGLNEGMTLQDFADVIAYLEARREEQAPKK